MKTVRAVAGVLLCTLGDLAAQENVCQLRPSLAVGGGSRTSCATYLAETQNRVFYDAWILGYISGANSYAPNFSQVGSNTDNRGMLAAIENLCRADPEKTLSRTVAAYIDGKTAACR
jgi:hypothetical protein